MTLEDKELLLKDLCARLPYGVRVFVSGDDFDNYQCPYLLIAISKFGQDIFCKIYSPIYTPLGCPGVENVKPYLFPLSSMTEEMMEEFDSLFNGTFQYFNQGVISASYLWDRNEAKFVGEHECSKLIDFFNSHHIDYRNLIEKGLAIDATGLNIY